MVDRAMMIDRRLDSFEDFPVRGLNALRADNIETVQDLVMKTEVELLRVPNFGRVMLDQVKEFLVAKGLRLGMDFLRARVAVIKNLNSRDQHLLEGDNLKVILRSVVDHVEGMLAVRRVSTINRDPQQEHHSTVARARVNDLDYIVRSWAMDRGVEF